MRKTDQQAANADGVLCEVVLTPRIAEQLRLGTKAIRVTPSAFVARLIGARAEAVLRHPSTQLELDASLDGAITFAEQAGNGPEDVCAALLNLVNVGTCDLMVPSLTEKKWTLVGLDAATPAVDGLRVAFAAQLAHLADDESVSLPTRPRWTALPEAEQTYQLTWVARLFDERLMQFSTDQAMPTVTRCRHCRAFMMNDRVRGPRRCFCTPEHRIAAQYAASGFKRKRAERARSYRADEKRRRERARRDVLK
jgi:hypothetical protein